MRESAAGQELMSSSLSTADFHILTPVATSWLGIAVFTDGQYQPLHLQFNPGG